MSHVVLVAILEESDPVFDRNVVATVGREESHGMLDGGREGVNLGTE